MSVASNIAHVCSSIFSFLLYKSERYKDCARAIIDADRMIRTSTSLLKAAVALTAASEWSAALWMVSRAIMAMQGEKKNP